MTADFLTNRLRLCSSRKTPCASVVRRRGHEASPKLLPNKGYLMRTSLLGWYREEAAFVCVRKPPETPEGGEKKPREKSETQTPACMAGLCVQFQLFKFQAFQHHHGHPPVQRLSSFEREKVHGAFEFRSTCRVLPEHRPAVVAHRRLGVCTSTLAQARTVNSRTDADHPGPRRTQTDSCQTPWRRVPPKARCP